MPQERPSRESLRDVDLHLLETVAAEGVRPTHMNETRIQATHSPGHTPKYLPVLT